MIALDILKISMNQFIHKGGRYISTTDTSIYVEETGATDGFPLIFLHGGLGSISDFSPLIGKITGNFRCIGIETRGHGKSTLGSQTFSYKLLETDIERVLDQLCISKCMMIGFSDGGIIAYRLAIKKPSLISKLITIGSDCDPPSQSLQTLFTNLTAESWESKFPGTIEAYKQLNPEANFNSLITNIIPMWLDKTPSGYPADKIKEIQCETLIIRGDHDHLMPRSSIARIFDHLPNAKLLNIPFAGHAAHHDQPEVVSMIINQFLQ